MGAHSRLGAYSNKYGSYDPTIFSFFFLLAKGTDENASMHITAMNATLMVCYKYSKVFQYLAGVSFWTGSLEQGVDICGEWST